MISYKAAFSSDCEKGCRGATVQQQQLEPNIITHNAAISMNWCEKGGSGRQALDVDTGAFEQQQQKEPNLISFKAAISTAVSAGGSGGEDITDPAVARIILDSVTKGWSFEEVQQCLDAEPELGQLVFSCLTCLGCLQS